MSSLSGKKGVIFGISDRTSIAYYIAKACIEQGAELTLTYHNHKDNVIEIGNELGAKLCVHCDFSNQDSIREACIQVADFHKHLDFCVHSVAGTNLNELGDGYIGTSPENFANTMNISCYSLTAISKHLSPIMSKGGSILTLSYYGAEKVIPGYNIMGVAKAALETSVKYLALDLGIDGIRVNAISSGLMLTPVTSKFPGFENVLDIVKRNSSLKRNVEGKDVAGAAVFLLSNASAGITGEIMHVDCGYNTMGMFLPQNKE